MLIVALSNLLTDPHFFQENHYKLKIKYPRIELKTKTQAKRRPQKVELTCFSIYRSISMDSHRRQTES